MAKIAGSTIPQEIEVLKPYAPYLMWEPKALKAHGPMPTLDDWHARFPTWSVESMVRGLTELSALAEKGNVLFDVYPPAEIEEDPSREHVKLWFMPSKVQPSDKPFILCYAGGAYQTVCSLAEAFPVAARMAELGYNVFMPTYRVGFSPLMPKPLEDIDAALGYILAHAEDFHLSDTRYVLNGFSAGAHLISLWGTESSGYVKYGKPKPHALFPVYTVSRFFTDDMDENSRMVMNGLLTVLLGPGFDQESADRYDVLKNMTAAYPPCYLVHARDDTTVDYRNSTDMAAALEACGIPCELELAENGEHGFGDGRGTAAYGWIERALRFSEALM